MDKKLLIPLFTILLVSLTASSHGTDYRDPEPKYTEINPIDLSEYSVLEERIENSGFSDYTEGKNKKADFKGWKENHGSTHHIGVSQESSTIDRTTLKTRWIRNGFNAKASISQEVNLTGVDAIKLDATGTKGNPYRSKIILEVDDDKQGTFIKSPQNKVYRDLGVNLEKDYRGEHTVRIKWVQIMGDNIGNSGIDNVKALSVKDEDYEGRNSLIKKEKLDRYTKTPPREPEVEEPGNPYNRSKVREPEMPSVKPEVEDSQINPGRIQKLISLLEFLL